MKKTNNQFPKAGLSRRQFLRMSGAALAAAALNSCGAQPGGAPTQSAAVNQDGELTFKGTLDVWDWEFPAREDLIKEMIEEWKLLHPEIVINYTPLPWADIETKILAAASAKNSPPVSDIYYAWRYELQRAGVIAPYPDDFANWNDRISTPFMKDEAGKVRAFPSGWYVDMVYYNKEAFEKEGLKPSDIPMKWDDFIKFAKDLTRYDADGKVSRSGCTINDYWEHEYLWQGLIYQQGGWMYNEDGTKALWEEEPSVNALQFIQDYYHTHKIDSRELPEGYGGFCNDLAIMMIGSGWNTGFFMADFPQMAGKWDTVRLPTFTGEMTPSVGLGSPEENFQVFNSYPDETMAASFAFIEHIMAGDDRALEWTKAQSCAPDSLKLIKDPRILEIPGVKSQAETLPFRVCFGERPIEAEKLWRTMFDQVLLEKAEVKSALAEATKGINEVLPTKQRFFTERNYGPPEA